MKNNNRSYLALGNYFSTPKGTFQVVGVVFKGGVRTGLQIINIADPNNEPNYIDEETILNNEKNITYL